MKAWTACLALAVALLSGYGAAGESRAATVRVAEPDSPAALAGLPNCRPASFDGNQDNVMRAYIAYYGRPADAGGLRYWADRVAAAGSLSAIMADFGVSKEFTDRYGGLGPRDLVTGIYRQLFGRNPDTAGLDYYVGELVAGRKTLQSIALDVLFGATGSDAIIIANRLAVAKSFTSGAPLQNNYLAEADGDALAAVLASVQDDSGSANAACASYEAMLDAQSGSLDARFVVTRFTDSDRGFCASDCSLREAVTAANAAGGRVGVALPAGTYTVTLGQMLITGDVHIHGSAADAVIIDGNASSRLFSLESAGARLVLSRVTLRNGYSDYGGALMNKGTTVLDRVVVSGNTARNGGGIINTGTLTGLSLKLRNNRAQSVDVNTGFGGGLFGESGSYALFAGEVAANTSAHNGAGLYAASRGTIVNAALVGNQAGGVGGGIDTMGALTIIGSRFSANTGNDGGAVSGREAGALLGIATSTFEDNVANGIDFGGGGAIFNYLGLVSVRDSVFNRNAAYGEGGGAIETSGALDLVSVTFDGNAARMHGGSLPGSAPGFGGAVLIIAGSTVTMDGARFSNNIAGNSGGAIYNDRNTHLSIGNSQFASNTAQGLYAGGGGYGGAIVSEGNLTLTGSTLSTNTSKVGGGALSTNVGVATISKSTISGNTSAYGGGIVAYTGTLIATDLLLSGNTSTQFAGGLLNDAAQAALTRVTMTGNTAKSWGGAFANNVAGRVSLVSSSISGNTAPEGSAFVNFGTIDVRDSTVSGSCSNHKTVNNQGGNTFSGCAF